MATRSSAESTAEAAVISAFFHLHLFTSAFCTFSPDIFPIWCGCMCDCGMRMVGKGCSSNNGLLIRSSESSWWIQTTATSWYREKFPLTQVQNVQASWPSAVVFLAEMQAMWGKVTVGLHWPFSYQFHLSVLWLIANITNFPFDLFPWYIYTYHAFLLPISACVQFYEASELCLLTSKDSAKLHKII